MFILLTMERYEFKIQIQYRYYLFKIFINRLFDEIFTQTVHFPPYFCSFRLQLTTEDVDDIIKQVKYRIDLMFGYGKSRKGNLMFSA